MLLLECQDGYTWKNHVLNCTHCHPYDVDGQIDPSLMVVPIILCCMLCEQSIKVANIYIYMLIGDRYSKGWHMGCHTAPLEEMLVGKWLCFWCIKQT
jgi:hypothetical protein